MDLFDWSEFTERNNTTESPIKIETHKVENYDEVVEYNLLYDANIDIIEGDELLVSFPEVDYITHFYEPERTPVHRFFFEENGNEKFYCQCTDVKLKELRIRVW